MAGLGAAAGAFEGDRAREEARARRIGLGLQAASLAQNDRQFAARQNLEREQMAMRERENEARRKESAEYRAQQQLNADRSFGLHERQFQADQEKEQYQRRRNEIDDVWRQEINRQTLLEKQERIKANRVRLEELDRVTKMERDQLANRKGLAQTGLGALALSAARNGGVASKAAIDLFNREQEEAGTGIKVTGGFWSDGGFSFRRLGPAVDQNGNPVQGQVAEYDELMSPAIIYAILKDEFGEDVAGAYGREAQNAFSMRRDQARHDAQYARASLRASNGGLSGAAKAKHEWLLGAYQRLLDERLDLDPNSKKDAKELARVNDKIAKIESQLAEIEGGGGSAAAGQNAGGSALGFVKGGGSGQGQAAAYPTQRPGAQRESFVRVRGPSGQTKDMPESEAERWLAIDGYSVATEQPAPKTAPAENNPRGTAQREATDIVEEPYDARNRVTPPVRQKGQTLEEHRKEYEAWASDNPRIRAMNKAKTPESEHSSLLPPVRKANETTGQYLARYRAWERDNPTKRFFEGWRSSPGTKPGKRWDDVVKGGD